MELGLLQTHSLVQQRVGYPVSEVTAMGLALDRCSAQKCRRGLVQAGNHGLASQHQEELLSLETQTHR